MKKRQHATSSQLACEWTTRERPREKHMLKAKESSARRHLATHLVTWPTRKMTRKMHCQSILVYFPYFFTYTLKAHITHILQKLLTPSL